MSNWHIPIDDYCERIGMGLLAEPVNAVTNISFFIAAALLLKHYNSSGQRNRPALLLILLTGLVGLGSLTFHTYATQLGQLLDIIPIVSFVLTFLWVALAQLFAVGITGRIAAIFIFLIASAPMFHLPPEHNFNGSAGYFTCLATIMLMGSVLAARRHAAASYFLHASLWFTASLTFRSIDMQLCDSFPLGTHFMWHVCNGFVLYLLTRAVVVQRIKF